MKMKYMFIVALLSVSGLAHSYNVFDLSDSFPDVVFAENENIPTWGWGNQLGEGAEISYSFAESDYFCGDHVVNRSCTSLSAFIEGDYQSVVSSAFDAWASVANLSFTQAQDQSGNVVIGGGEIGGVSTTLGYGGFNVRYTGFEPASSYIISGFLNLNSSVDWSDTDMLFGVALHEIGHVLGLDHSDDSSSIMYYLYSSDLRTLQPDDIAGIQYLYGAPVSAVPEPSVYALFILGLAMLWGYGRVTSRG